MDIRLTVPDAGNVCKRAFYQLKIVLISRFHGLIDPFVIIYQRGVRVLELVG